MTGAGNLHFLQTGVALPGSAFAPSPTTSFGLPPLAQLCPAHTPAPAPAPTPELSTAQFNLPSSASDPLSGNWSAPEGRSWEGSHWALGMAPRVEICHSKLLTSGPLGQWLLK